MKPQSSWKRWQTAAIGYAQYLTGILYRDGGLLIPDTEKAQHYLELAAQQDHAAAQYALGRLLLSDDPEVQNPAQGLYWLERAAESGNDYAAYRLGKEYLSGKNTPKNPERAAEYVRMAAEQGNPYAQYLLGKLYLSGDGVPQDRDAAYDWFQKAQAQGHDLCRIFHGPHRATGAAERSALGNSTALPHGKDFSKQRACAAKQRHSDRPQTPCQAASDAYRRRTQGGRSRAGADKWHHVDGLVARFKICTP